MGFTNPDGVLRPSSGLGITAGWGDTVNDDLNYLYSAAGVAFGGTYSFTYATGGSVIPYGRTFTTAPFPVPAIGDDTGADGIIVVGASNTTSSFKVKLTSAGVEVAAGGSYRVNWIVVANV